MSSLKYVSNAIRHGEVLMGEAEDLGEFSLAALLARGVEKLIAAVEVAFDANELLPEAKRTKQMAQRSLRSYYDKATCELEQFVPGDMLFRLTPASHLDVAERTRFRLRRLELAESAGCEIIRVRLQSALSAYEQAIDCYLQTCTEARAEREKAVVLGQRFRLDLERAKAHLLTVAETDSVAYARIRSRVVRTKKARWLAPLIELSDDFGNDEMTNPG